MNKNPLLNLKAMAAMLAPKKSITAALVGAAVMMLSTPSASAAIVIGDFTEDYDGWAQVGAGGFSEYYSSERVEEGGIWSLRASYLPDSEGTFLGWMGLVKEWDATGQQNVTQLSFDISSASPWKVQIFAYFTGGIGQRDLNIFWPGTDGTAEIVLSSSDFGLTDAEFNGLFALRMAMDANSAINGGHGNPAMTFQISDVQLNGTAIPEPSSMALLGIGAISVGCLLRRKKLAA
jgi:hypothetical protein